MHERDSWAGADGEKHDGKYPKGFKAISDCLELHKLTMFTADAAERQRYFQQGIRKLGYHTSVHFPSGSPERVSRIPPYAEEQTKDCCDYQEGERPLQGG
jgi:hypothetical protein